MPQKLENMRVIIVDDQSAARAMLRKMLKELHISQIFEAADGASALSFLDSASDMIDLIICDWNMPSMTGLDLLRQVRSTGSEVHFLMMTGRADRESVVEAKSAGVTGYIAKPYSLAHLEAKLRVCLARMNAPA